MLVRRGLGVLFWSVVMVSAAALFVPASDARIGFQGRFTAPAPDVRFDWPCASITLSVAIAPTADAADATISALLMGGGSRFLATLTEEVPSGRGGRVLSRLQLNSTSRKEPENVTVAALGATAADFAGRATLRLRKLSEASEDGHVPPALAQATASFGGFALGGGISTAAAAAPPTLRRIEFFGASDTAGFGVDGFPEPAGGTAECLLHMVRYESCDESYAARLAAALGAAPHVQAWAGKGLRRNADQLIPAAFGAPMPAYFNRTLATDGSAATAWNWRAWVPDVIVVSLGGNDFNNAIKPTQREFEAAYHAMLDSLFDAYHGAHGAGGAGAKEIEAPVVVSICGGGSPGDPSRNRACPFVNASVSSYARAVARQYYVEVPVGVVPDGFSGCLGHHNREGSQMVADFLEPRIRQIMGW